MRDVKAPYGAIRPAKYRSHTHLRLIYHYVAELSRRTRIIRILATVWSRPASRTSRDTVGRMLHDPHGGARMGTCPQCKSAISTARATDVQLIDEDGGQWYGKKYACPNCGCVLSVSIDPVRQKDEIVSEILAALGRGGH